MLRSAKGFWIRRLQSGSQCGNKTERTGIQSDTDFSETKIRSQKAQTLKLHLLFWFTRMYMLNIGKFFGCQPVVFEMQVGGLASGLLCLKHLHRCRGAQAHSSREASTGGSCIEHL